ncbi:MULTISPECIES: transglutaminase domain-containing protein [unclassified Streptococcus]|uniref:transglutaminase domain-containing protein n=1 Tax=unclassified Streptococcus TaxID=2608887 RepID=UPI001071BA2A|nr:MULTISPECIES: transglutaminase domain-containing protein [unclassified Streptococcus]MBF0786375.1 transglutaminase [Streptococcus sp. 19428wC2_LYSM12]MCQ9212483.1 transglutaminase [Streptococcus sp. B01]MCQ9213822.1 transglutaminase [Streptococcus sp. O1]TFV06784.1 transglutaminase [Streptococcus sp. LYSM12]
MKKVPFSLLTLLSVAFLSACSIQKTSDQLEHFLAEASQEKKQLEAELINVKEEVQKNFYYQQLATEKERRIYLQFVNGLKKRAQVIDIESTNEENYVQVYLSVAYDYPEFYWLTDEEAMTDGINFLDLEEPTYPSDLSLVNNQLEKQVTSILEQAPTGSDYEKVKYFYEVIIKQTEYDIEAFKNKRLNWRSQGILSVLLDKKSVCAGYSRTFQYLCKKAGIDCIYVSGVAKGSSGEEIGHAWNLVKINGQYYGVDTTWGDPVFDQAMGSEIYTDISYDYLCVPSEMLERSRVAHKSLLQYWGIEPYAQSQELTYPVCTDNSLNYYVQKGVYFTNFNEAAVLQSITEQRLQGVDKIFIQFASKEDMQQMMTLASTENNAIFQALGEVENYKYVYNEQTYTFEITAWY